MKKIPAIVMFLLISLPGMAQLEISAEWRPRSEFRDGYTTLSEPNEKGVLLITQRSRFNLHYTDKHQIESYVSFQDIRAWGQYGLNTTESALSLYQAWVQLPVSNRFKVKVGRQEFEYDDLKILSNSDWRLPARAHDAFLLKYTSKDSTFQAHIAGAINNEEEVVFPQVYTEEGTYKNMGMLWLNKQLTKGEVSFLLLNLGQQSTDSTININQFLTLGTYATYRIGSTTLTGSYYHQTGENELNQEVSANMASLSLEIPMSSAFSVTPGFDLLSGTSAQDQLNTASGTNTFIPLYARRHRYFGVQDMFYFAGFIVQSGLHDYFLKLQYQPNKKWKTRLQMHTFSTAASIVDASDDSVEANRHLGFEADLLVDYYPNADLRVSFGYTQFFATKSMEVLKQRGDADEIAHFAFLALTYTPTLFRN